jgi:hypothetical protein
MGVPFVHDDVFVPSFVVFIPFHDAAARVNVHEETLDEKSKNYE